MSPASIQWLTSYPLQYGSMGPYFFHRFAGLSRSHFHPQIRGTFFTQSLFVIPASRTTYPTGTARTLNEIRSKFLRGCYESLVMSLFPGYGANSLAYISSSAEKSPQQNAGCIQYSLYGSCNRWLEPGPESTATAVTVKLKLEPLVGTEVTVIPYKLNFIRHTFPSCSSVNFWF